LLLVAVVGIVLLLMIDSWQTWQQVRLQPYILQRCFFRLATFVDFPLVQLGLIGLWLRSSDCNSASKKSPQKKDIPVHGEKIETQRHGENRVFQAPVPIPIEPK